ncbi:hypothetical protein F7Q99_28490 [Streptomyces kaniharaensis]|uniref:Uncharacterized protein n=1 Tax=Streptomyces kaniharaensis TaxID=212423 RepID=A0A6N7L2Q7_9ACTN|nr:hypothetical protein [Streptomyces kaniharaensis]MQS16073.1 hypothetical protein [Streptomyces kaniharaensis]
MPHHTARQVGNRPTPLPHPDGRYAFEPDPQPQDDVCTCPRLRPWLRVALTRPERTPAEPPF